MLATLGAMSGFVRFCQVFSQYLRGGGLRSGKVAFVMRAANSDSHYS